MKITNFLKAAAGKAVHFKDGFDKNKAISLARDEVHQFAYGVVVKQLIIFSSIFFVVGFIFGCAITWMIA
jgi:hypothetical protein